MSKNFHQTLILLGLVPRGGNYELLRERIQELGVDTSHFQRRRMLSSCSDEDVTEAVNKSRSIARALAKLGMRWTSSKHRTLKLRIERLNLDRLTSSVRDGERERTTPVVPPRPLAEVLVIGRRFKSSTLRERLIREGLKQRKCEMCGRASWNGRPIPLELDHVNGRRDDNRLENLRILCPNCHAQTDTYRGRNIGIGDPRFVESVSPGWRKGSRIAPKKRGPSGRVGSSPTPGTRQVPDLRKEFRLQAPRPMPHSEPADDLWERS